MGAANVYNEIDVNVFERLLCSLIELHKVEWEEKIMNKYAVKRREKHIDNILCHILFPGIRLINKMQFSVNCVLLILTIPPENYSSYYFRTPVVADNSIQRVYTVQIRYKGSFGKTK